MQSRNEAGVKRWALEAACSIKKKPKRSHLLTHHRLQNQYYFKFSQFYFLGSNLNKPQMSPNLNSSKQVFPHQNFFFLQNLYICCMLEPKSHPNGIRHTFKVTSICFNTGCKHCLLKETMTKLSKWNGI